MEEIKINKNIEKNNDIKVPEKEIIKEVPKEIVREAPKEVMEKVVKEKPKVKRNYIRLVVLAAVLVGVVVGAPYVFNWYKANNMPDLLASPYYAIFLTNGQVYFGKLVDNDKKEEMVISNVYYVNVGQNATIAQAQAEMKQPTFQLVKLGNELHGPTDKMFINKTQVVFYEQLRKDSKVVESMEGQK